MYTLFSQLFSDKPRVLQINSIYYEFLLIVYILKSTPLVLAVTVSMALSYDKNGKEQTSIKCDMWCPYIYFPVCGTDGEIYKVFSNECFMDRQSCLDKKGEYKTIITVHKKNHNFQFQNIVQLKMYRHVKISNLNKTH